MNATSAAPSDSGSRAVVREIMMRLWTIQPLEVWEALQREGSLWCDPDHLDRDLFYTEYRWMRAQIARRIPGYQGHFPWWAWKQWYPEHAKPDLRNRELHGGYDPGESIVRLELEIEDRRVLLSDFDLWGGFVLNRAYLGMTEAEYDRGWHYWRVTSVPNEELIALERSWEWIFALEYPDADPEWLGGKAAKRIQAVFEELRLADVRHVTHFRARPRMADFG